MLLKDGLSHEGVVLVIFHHVGPGVGLLGGGHLLKGGDLHEGVGTCTGVGDGGACAANIGDLPHRCAGGQPGGDLPGGGLPHAVGEKVRLGIEEDGAAHLVFPVVVVGEAAQAGLQPTDDDGDVAEHLPHPVGVDDSGPVGAQARLPAGRVGVIVAALFRRRIVGHHGVQVPAGDQHPQPGASQGGEGLRPPPVGLGENGHPVALRLQYPADDGGAEGGVIHIGIPGDEEKVVKVPAPAGHVLPGDREKKIAVKFHGEPRFSV